MVRDDGGFRTRKVSGVHPNIVARKDPVSRPSPRAVARPGIIGPGAVTAAAARLPSRGLPAPSGRPPPAGSDRPARAHPAPAHRSIPVAAVFPGSPVKWDAAPRPRTPRCRAAAPAGSARGVRPTGGNAPLLGHQPRPDRLHARGGGRGVCPPKRCAECVDVMGMAVGQGEDAVDGLVGDSPPPTRASRPDQEVAVVLGVNALEGHLPHYAKSGYASFGYANVRIRVVRSKSRARRLRGQRAPTPAGTLLQRHAQ